MKKYDIMLYPIKHESKKVAQKYVGAIKNSILRYPKKLTVKEIAAAQRIYFKENQLCSCWRRSRK